MQLKHFTTYAARVAVRPEYGGRPAKPEALAINGTPVRVVVAWGMADDDAYPGEYAMQREDRECIVPGIPWIASGDLEIIGEV